ncbi:hypothetical protein BKA57DRAFT_143730, partial [Linnemannia elongata]
EKLKADAPKQCLGEERGPTLPLPFFLTPHRLCLSLWPLTRRTFYVMLICVVGVVAVMLFHEALIGKTFHMTVAVGGTIRLVNVKAVFRTFLGICVCGSWFLLSGGGGGGNGVSLIGSLGQKLGSSVLGARQECASVHVTTTFLDSS